MQQSGREAHSGHRPYACLTELISCALLLLLLISVTTSSAPTPTPHYTICLPTYLHHASQRFLLSICTTSVAATARRNRRQLSGQLVNQPSSLTQPNRPHLPQAQAAPQSYAAPSQGMTEEQMDREIALLSRRKLRLPILKGESRRPSPATSGPPPLPRDVYNVVPLFSAYDGSATTLQTSPSTLRPAAWREALALYPGTLGNTLVGILTFGALLGYEGPLTLLLSKKNSSLLILIPK